MAVNKVGEQIVQQQVKGPQVKQKQTFSKDGLGAATNALGVNKSAQKMVSSNSSSALLPDDQPMKLTSKQVAEFSGKAAVKLRDSNEEDGDVTEMGMLTVSHLQRLADAGSIEDALNNLGSIGVEEGDLKQRESQNQTVMRAEQRVRDLEKIMNDGPAQERNSKVAAAASQMVDANPLLKDKKITGVKMDLDPADPSSSLVLKMMAISAQVNGSAAHTDGEVNIARLFKKAHDFSALQKEAVSAMNNVSVNPGAMTAAVSRMKAGNMGGGAAQVAGMAGKIDIKSE